MHESLIDDVKLHVDEVAPDKDQTLVKGWCASDNVEVKEIRLFANKKYFFDGECKEERKDVYEHYNQNKKFLKSGFVIPVPDKLKGNEDIFLQIKRKNKWENIKKLDNEVSIHFKEIESNFSINKSLDTNLIVVDNFYEDPFAVREFALSLSSFNPHPDFHKGQRTEQVFRPEEVKKVLSKLLHKKITKWEEHGANGVFQYCTSEDALVYHVDTQTYAAVVFLTPNAPPECGTTFYKSKINGLREDPTDEISKKLNKSKEELMSEIFASGYYDKTKLEVVDVVGNVFNRLVVWDAKLIHAASEYFGSNLRDSRLFHMFFFDAEEQ